MARGRREAIITEMIRKGKRQFTLEEAVNACYPPGVERPRWYGRCVASTLRSMIQRGLLSRNSKIGRGHKGLYTAKGRKS